MTAFVYVMECADAECIKIGIAKDVGKRLALLQCGNPLKIRAVYCRKFEPRRASQVERAAHRRFKDRRVSGEWFRASAADAKDFISNQSAEFIAVQKKPRAAKKLFADMNGTEKAAEYAGGTFYSLAKLLGVTPGAITKWRKEGGLPPGRAIELEQISGGALKAIELLPERAA